MEDVIVSQKSKEYWRRINICIQSVCLEIADNCYNELLSEYGDTLTENISQYYASLKDEGFDNYIKVDIQNYISRLPVKDKVLLRAAQYQLGDELSAKTEMDRMIEFIVGSFSNHVKN